MERKGTDFTAQEAKAASFFSIFPLLGRVLWRYGKRLFSLETLVSLEKKQGVGSGQRTDEEILLEQALERNPHQLHISREDASAHEPTQVSMRVDDKPLILVVKKEEK
jgi:hypothetical protein